MPTYQQLLDASTAAQIKRPNFFILGAGRCGSTTLYSMLRRHPQVFMPSTKEPSFFCSYFQVVKDPISYFKLFDAADREIAIGEASHVYLSNPESPPLIRALFPDARFILIFRNPTERAYSLYRWAHNAGLEPLQEFEQALEAEDNRYRDPDFFRNCPYYFWNYMYVRSSYFHLQWTRYLRLFPRERFFALGLEELKNDPKFWMREIFEFLGVDGSIAPSLEHRNSSPSPRIKAATRRRLDHHFREVIDKTNILAGRDLRLG